LGAFRTETPRPPSRAAVALAGRETQSVSENAALREPRPIQSPAASMTPSRKPIPTCDQLKSEPGVASATSAEPTPNRAASFA
jgi:hypothetical protein